MVRRGQGTWQQSPAYLRDQERIERLVHHVGRATLCFTAYDVAREARHSTSLRLEESRHLNRHLKCLTPAVLRVVSSTLRVDTAGNGGSREVKRYVLASRYAEWEQSGGGLTDREKVLAALWIACAVLQLPHVPTIAVTRVLQLVPALALSTTVQTHVALAVLADGPDPVEREVVVEAAPWCHWRLMGTVQHPRLDAWVQLVRDTVRAEGPAVL